VTLTRINPIRGVALLGLLALASAVIGLVLASPASAQFPSGCVEYDDDPCIGPIDNVDEDGNDGVGPGDGSGDADGKLPFTGYPLTGLILLLLVLLAVGLTIRSGTALRDKLARRH